MSSANTILNNLTTSSITALPMLNTQLPPVDWQSIGAPHHLIPQPIPLPQQKTTDPLPKADIVVVTWTAAEWMAMHQVLCASPRAFSVEPDYNLSSAADWRSGWIPYRYEFDQIEPYLQQVVKDKKGGAPSLQNHAWARICMTKIGDLRVLLVKSDMHLAQDGPRVPLQQFTQKICREAQPRLILSIGTAGAVRKGDELGSVLVSNQGYFDLTKKVDGSLLKDYIPEFAALDHSTVRSGWIPGDSYLNVAQNGFISISEPDVLPPTPAYEANIIKAKPTRPVIHTVLDSPVITTDTFLFGSSDYELEKDGCIVEMDDAVVGDICQREGVAFGFVRNVSDPVISQELNTPLKSIWAAYIYQEYGLASSYNGALASWALVAATAGQQLQDNRSRIQWHRVSPAPLRDTLALQPLTVTEDNLLQQAYCLTHWEQAFFISHPDGLMRLTFDPAQSRFVPRLMLETSTRYHTLSPFVITDAAWQKQLYLFAYQQEENRFDIFKIEADALQLEHSFCCGPHQERFTVTHAFEGYRCNLLMAYNKETGDSRIYQITQQNGLWDISLLWQKGWAPGWEHFCFFTWGKENFFFKTNVNPAFKNKMVNIDHYMDTPTDGAHPVCTKLPEAALEATSVAGIPLPEGPGLIFAGKNGFSIQRIHSDCEGWQRQFEKACDGPIQTLYVLPLANHQTLLGIVKE